MIEFHVAPTVAAFVVPAVLAVEGVAVVEHDARMDAPLAESERIIRGSPEASHVVAAVRAMYRRFGVDPTKTRPSSEALLRRLRKGESLPRINSAVDLGNWCSVETLLPYGLYDLGRTRGALELRLGRDGEEYAGIRKDAIHVAGRLTVADADGPFGNPTSDSSRTMVTSSTTRLLVVVYAPASLQIEAGAALALTTDRVLRFTGGQVAWSAVVGPAPPA